MPLDKRGMPAVNPQTQQIGDLPIFLAGDANTHAPLLHEAGVEAVSTPQGWRLDGQSLAIPFGDRAPAFIVPARPAGELLVLLVRPGLPGLEIDAYPTFDGRTAVNLGFDKAAVAAEALLGSGAPAEAESSRDTFPSPSGRGSTEHW